MAAGGTPPARGRADREQPRPRLLQVQETRAHLVVGAVQERLLERQGFTSGRRAHGAAGGPWSDLDEPFDPGDAIGVDDRHPLVFVLDQFGPHWPIRADVPVYPLVLDVRWHHAHDRVAEHPQPHLPRLRMGPFEQRNRAHVVVHPPGKSCSTMAQPDLVCAETAAPRSSKRCSR